METIQHNPPTFFYGIITCLIGFLLCYFVGRRRFNRRGIGGLQQYSGYGSALVTTLCEKLLKVIGIVLIIAGLFILLNRRSQQNHKGSTQQHAEIVTLHHHHKKSN